MARGRGVNHQKYGKLITSPTSESAARPKQPIPLRRDVSQATKDPGLGGQLRRLPFPGNSDLPLPHLRAPPHINQPVSLHQDVSHASFTVAMPMPLPSQELVRVPSSGANYTASGAVHQSHGASSPQPVTQADNVTNVSALDATLIGTPTVLFAALLVLIRTPMRTRAGPTGAQIVPNICALATVVAFILPSAVLANSYGGWLLVAPLFFAPLLTSACVGIGSALVSGVRNSRAWRSCQLPGPLAATGAKPPNLEEVLVRALYVVWNERERTVELDAINLVLLLAIAALFVARGVELGVYLVAVEAVLMFVLSVTNTMPRFLQRARPNLLLDSSRRLYLPANSSGRKTAATVLVVSRKRKGGMSKLEEARMCSIRDLPVEYTLWSQGHYGMGQGEMPEVDQPVQRTFEEPIQPSQFERGATQERNTALLRSCAEQFHAYFRSKFSGRHGEASGITEWIRGSGNLEPLMFTMMNSAAVVGGSMQHALERLTTGCGNKLSINAVWVLANVVAMYEHNPTTPLDDSDDVKVRRGGAMPWLVARLIDKYSGANKGSASPASKVDPVKWMMSDSNSQIPDLDEDLQVLGITLDGCFKNRVDWMKLFGQDKPAVLGDMRRQYSTALAVSANRLVRLYSWIYFYIKTKIIDHDGRTTVAHGAADNITCLLGPKYLEDAALQVGAAQVLFSGVIAAKAVLLPGRVAG